MDTFDASIQLEHPKRPAPKTARQRIAELEGEVKQLREMLANPLIRCAECDFSRRKGRDDTPDHDCPEPLRAATQGEGES